VDRQEAVVTGTVGAVGPAKPATRRRLTRRQRARLSRGVQYTVLVVIVVVFVAVSDRQRLLRAFFDLDVMRAQFPGMATVALKNTVLYSASGFAFGLVLGVVLALMKLSSVGPYRWFATAYVELFRGIPGLLVFIALGYGLSFAVDVRFDTYMAETIRAGVQAVPTGQVEAARSLGMTPTATLRTIVLPQALRTVLPPLTNELILLTKDSSLVYLLGLTPEQYELSKYGRGALTEFRSLSPIVVAGLCYLALTLPLSQLSRQLERRFGVSNSRRRTVREQTTP
jgi:polar amino acid transport system permease protein